MINLQKGSCCPERPLEASMHSISTLESRRTRLSRWSAVVLRNAAEQAWRFTQAAIALLPAGQIPSPRWAPGKLLTSKERSAPPLGVPRTTDSLCPKCTLETRDAILQGREDISKLKHNPGIIKADIIEEAGRVLMRKICDKHGPFEDVLASNADFFRRIESLYRGRDFACAGDGHVHDHGVSSIRFGRGAYLVFDLTNRCNMKCTPCFMDANAVGHVHELGLDDIKTILNQARSFKPNREVIVLFSGGEPTVSPLFLDAVRCAGALGFRRLHVATNGIRFAEDREFAWEARQAGLLGVYLQFDGVSEGKNGHRGVGNLFEVKLQALENIARAGLRVTLQSTVINGVNEDQVGPIVEFAIRNSDKIFNVVFQPIMFAGRDEDVDDERRYRQRYTLSQLAEDLQAQVHSDWQPLRDWFPLAVINEFSNLVDLLRGPDAPQGSVAANDHPDWGAFSPLVVNRDSKVWMPVTRFFDLERFLQDVTSITDAARGKSLTYTQLALAILRNYRPEKAPEHFRAADLFDLFRQCCARANSLATDWPNSEYTNREWQLFTVFGRWFQDLFAYDLRVIEMSTTPVATQEGEISFCAYNSAGWRHVIEHKHQTATLSEWHREHGRHPVYAGGKLVPLASLAGTVELAEREKEVAEALSL